jgi:hypothetical protein
MECTVRIIDTFAIVFRSLFIGQRGAKLLLDVVCCKEQKKGLGQIGSLLLLLPNGPLVNVAGAIQNGPSTAHSPPSIASRDALTDRCIARKPHCSFQNGSWSLVRDLAGLALSASPRSNAIRRNRAEEPSSTPCTPYAAEPAQSGSNAKRWFSKALLYVWSNALEQAANATQDRTPEEGNLLIFCSLASPPNTG